MFLWVRNPGPVWLGSLFQGLWQSVSQGCDLFWCSSRGHLLSSQGCWKDAVAFFFFLILLCQVLVVACGIWFHDQGSNLGPLHREHGVLVTDYQGNPWIQCLMGYQTRGLSSLVAGGHPPFLTMWASSWGILPLQSHPGRKIYTKSLLARPKWQCHIL